MDTPSTPASTPSTPSGGAAASAAPHGPRPASSGRPYAGGRRPGGRPDSDRGPAGRGGGRMRRGPIRRKVCRFCAEKVFEVDYKAIHIVRSFMTARGKILSGRTTGNCAKHQRQITLAIKRAQNIALLPTTGE